MQPTFLDYDKIGPSHRYLADEAVLQQAFRKSIEYIRRHNWYSDVLELDVAALDTPQVVRDCARVISKEKYKSFKPTPMRIVPVPKAEQWSLRGDKWAADRDVRWRPLAHLSVRDQTLATATMICLADLVETEQGDSRTPIRYSVDKQLRKSVSNYGNRLYCQWHAGKAKFNWGNSKTYREYFEDYRTFVARPSVVAEENRSKKIAIVNVDIERFYDCIDRSLMVQKLRELAEKRGDDRLSPRFFDCLNRIFDWSWDSRDTPILQECFGGSYGNGIPQGLVSGGFFANAYMLDLDRYLRRKIDGAPTSFGWVMLDYCRYVDDIRLVIKYDDPNELNSLKSDIVNFLLRAMKRYAPGLRLNERKTDVLPVVAQPSVVQVGATMQSLQSQVSGPIDPTSANQVLATLTALFPLAEQAARNAESQEGDESLLSELQSAELDVRPDTVERFAAHRWRRVYRTLRAMTDQPDTGSSKELRALDEKAGRFSRTLIRRWIADPSNVRLLRVAFDVMPDVVQLERYVLSLIVPHCFSTGADKTPRYVAWYTLSELLKAGATETAFVQISDELCGYVDVSKYREKLGDLATECQRNAAILPWYLLQQSALYLLVNGKDATTSASCGQHYVTALACMRGKWRPDPKTLHRDLPIVLRAIDFGANSKKLREQIVALGERLEPPMKRKVLRRFDNHTGEEVGVVATATELPADRPVPLETAIDHPSAPFAQENSALRLAERFIELLIRTNNRSLSVSQMDVSVLDWGLLADPSRSDALRLQVSDRDAKRTLAAPSWCRPANRWRLDLSTLLCRALRQKQSSPPETKGDLRYRPVRVQRTGMLARIAISRHQLGSPSIPVSPWMEEFLMHLGQWPGFVPFSHLVALSPKFDREDALLVIRSRLKEQEALFGRASKLPIYEVPVNFGHRKKRKDSFIVMLVQTAVPKRKDFTTHGLTLDDPAYRRSHRRHLASVFKLIMQTIDTRSTHAGQRRVDLIVLPELSVHPRDMHLVRLLISKTRAWVFCGLVFEKTKHSGQIVNRGTWLIPTFRSDGVRSSRQLLRFDQGKHHLTPDELAGMVEPSRDCQWVLVGHGDDESARWRLSASICYDSTDLRLAADLRDVTDGYIVSALNKDVPTFDNMIAALHYHMFQHVVLVNSGEYGGSSVQAPYAKHYVKNRVHAHGSDQVVISICEMGLLDFRHGRKGVGEKEAKTPPAGFIRGGKPPGHI